MSTTINGHTLTQSQLRTLREVSDYLLKNAGDTGASATTSPRGDGQSFDVYKIFGRSNQATAHRRNLYFMETAGILRGCEIEYRHRVDGHVAYRPLAPAPALDPDPNNISGYRDGL